MKFYNREEEIRYLRSVYKLAKDSSKMLFVTGRRRIGKTRLVLEAFKRENFVYFFVSRKDEKLLAEELLSIVKDKLGVDVLGEFNRVSQIFEYIMRLSEKRRIILAIDEFQEFYKINPSLFSEIQKIWDKYKDNSKLFVIFLGSMYSLMKKIFEGKKEPLFGRSFGKIILNPFNVNVLKRIYRENFDFNVKDFFAFYVFTGGVPRYVEILVESKAFSFDTMLENIVSPFSYFIDEGKELLIEEFGKDYKTYFSILALIASSKTSRSEIESILNKNVGGYLSMLEKEYGVIEKIRHIFAKENSKSIKYRIKDNFLNFWFRFVYKYRSIVELGDFKKLREIIKRDFNTYSGVILERYFKEKLALQGKYTEIGSYWEKGFKNEIDIVAVDDFNKKVLFADVKLNKNKIDIKILKEKSKKLLNKLRDYEPIYKGFSLNDV